MGKFLISSSVWKIPCRFLGRLLLANVTAGVFLSHISGNIIPTASYTGIPLWVLKAHAVDFISYVAEAACFMVSKESSLGLDRYAHLFVTAL